MKNSIKITDILGNKQEYYLKHICKTIDKSVIHTPSPNILEQVWIDSDRNIPTLNNFQHLLNHGRLSGTGYLSILPVDQGIEHSAGASLLRILFILTRKILQNWPLKADVMRLFLLLEHWEA